MLFSPGTDVVNDMPAAETATVFGEPAKPVPQLPGLDPGTASGKASTDPTNPATPAASVDVGALLAAISADRDQREKSAKSAEEATTYRARAEKAEAVLADIEKAKKNRLLDPAGFLRKMGYTDRDLALTSEGIMFSLMPDKAPADHVAKLVRAQREQDLLDAEEREKQRDIDSQKRAAESQTAQERQLEARYVADLKSNVVALKPGTFPATQAWYADDHDAYVQELLATARSTAEQASKAGTRADISPAGIAALVEKKYAERAQRLLSVFKAQPTGAQPQQNSPANPATAQQAEIISGKTRYNEKDLIAAAVRAAFGAAA